jgi:hypothetical protein
MMIDRKEVTLAKDIPRNFRLNCVIELLIKRRQKSMRIPY